MPKFWTLSLSLLLAAFLCGTAQAHEGHDQAGQEARHEVPSRLPKNSWACIEIQDLSAKYHTPAELPNKEVLDRKDLAAPLLALIDKVMEKCQREGADAVPAEDLERIGALYQELKQELAQYEGYEVRREEIEKMLEKPELPEFVYKVGVNGFVRGEGVRNFHLPDFSYAPDHGEARFLYRVKPYLYWHPTDWLDLHAEGQGYGYRGGSHQEHNSISLYQGFVQAKIPGSDAIAVKAGRQEFNYGSAFILGPEAFYDGLSFDAGLVRLKPVEPLTVDILAGRYATPFSNGMRGNLAGAYATWAFSEGNGIDAYAFSDSGSTEHHAGEYRATWGLRGTAKAGPVAIEVEPVYQSGETFNGERNDRVEAYGGHVDLSAEGTVAGFNNKWFASYAYGSGSREAATGSTARREFVNQNTDTSLTGDMNVIGDLSGADVGDHHASGLQIYTLGWGIDLTKELNFSATGRYFRANAVEEGFSKNLGLETDFTLTYNAAEGLSFLLGYDRFFTGSFFRNSMDSRNGIQYGYLMVQFDLSKSKPKIKPRKG